MTAITTQPIKIERPSSTPGRKPTVDPNEVVQWRIDIKASRQQTAEHFGLSESYVMELWRKAGMAGKSPVPTGGTSFKKDWEAIADYRREYRTSITETCRVFGVGRTTVTRACQAHGVRLDR
ncbi:MAG: hypothetical protein U5L98_12860 [Halomonas sp.]|uniref:hypothetical protein n=1 Tax=Halomonas sp. TaxID=1486246 RepID=UPI002ACE28BA|nr:hypothetical protein [Halomonas sp.]MDZ7853497.1 hypothetical protein [Halomonas sp.]